MIANGKLHVAVVTCDNDKILKVVLNLTGVILLKIPF